MGESLSALGTSIEASQAWTNGVCIMRFSMEAQSPKELIISQLIVGLYSSQSDTNENEASVAL